MTMIILIFVYDYYGSILSNKITPFELKAVFGIWRLSLDGCCCIETWGPTIIFLVEGVEQRGEGAVTCLPCYMMKPVFINDSDMSRIEH